MSSEVIFTLGFIVGLLIGGLVSMFLLCCFIVGDDEHDK